MQDILLQIKDLAIQYLTHEATVKAVNGIEINLNKGETLGLVGETGAGKTTTALGILRLLPKDIGKITSGSIIFQGKNLLDLPEGEMREIRGQKISMIFQDPMTSLNPILSVGQQIAEVLELHEKKSHSEIQSYVDEILELVGIPKERKYEYPHQFSGGMKQRVVIAMALACNPMLLIADEPTTALDVTIQAQILDMMGRLKKEFNTAMIMITHDLGIVAQICDKVAIMYAGEIVETGSVEDIFERTKHPYTKGLFNSIPDLEAKRDRLISIDGLMPDPTDLPQGCKFHPRCSETLEICSKREPIATEEMGHIVKCFRYSEISAPLKEGK